MQIKKNALLILIILATLLLVAIVMWVFDKKIENIEKGKSNSAITNKTQTQLLIINHF